MKKVLEEIGLNKNEILVYDTLLYKGEMTPSQIAENSGLSRTNAYAVLKGLLKKNIIKEFEKRKKLTYQVEHPQKLLDFVKEKRQKQEEAYKDLSLYMPKLIGDYEIITSTPGASYHKGLDELRRVYDEIIGLKKDVYVIASKYGRERKDVSKFMQEYLDKQSKAGIRSKAIVPITSDMKKFDIEEDEYKKRAKKNLVEIKAFPPTFITYSQVLVYGNTVAITSFKNEIHTTWIGDKEMAQTFRTIFMTLWDSEIGEKIT